MKRLLSFLKTNVLTENTTVLLLLGLAPLLGGTKTLAEGASLGLCAIFVLVMTGISVSAIGKFLPPSLKKPSFMVIAAFYVTLCEIFLNFFLPQIREGLGIYLPLLSVSGLLFPRAVSAENEKVSCASISGLGTGIGFFATALCLSFFRELFGCGTFFGLRIIPERYAIGALSTPFGALVLFGLIFAGVRYVNTKTTKEDIEK